MTYNIDQEWLTNQFVSLGKTSRQISREFKISRKVINKYLLEFKLISKRDLGDNDLP